MFIVDVKQQYNNNNSTNQLLLAQAKYGSSAYKKSNGIISRQDCIFMFGLVPSCTLNKSEQNIVLFAKRRALVSSEKFEHLEKKKQKEKKRVIYVNKTNIHSDI